MKPSVVAIGHLARRTISHGFNAVIARLSDAPTGQAD